MSVQPRISSGGTGKRPEEIVEEMAQDFLQQVPDAAKSKAAHPETYKKTKQGGVVSVGVFHSQVPIKTEALGCWLAGVREDRDAHPGGESQPGDAAQGARPSPFLILSEAIKGTVLMSAELEGM